MIREAFKRAGGTKGRRSRECDIVVAPAILGTVEPPLRLLADKAYDIDAFRALLTDC
jgi:hypothetical protein